MPAGLSTDPHLDDWPFRDVHWHDCDGKNDHPIWIYSVDDELYCLKPADAERLIARLQAALEFGKQAPVMECLNDSKP